MVYFLVWCIKLVPGEKYKFNLVFYILVKECEPDRNNILQTGGILEHFGKQLHFFHHLCDMFDCFKNQFYQPQGTKEKGRRRQKGSLSKQCI